jgi:HlyD family secretion protein
VKVAESDLEVWKNEYKEQLAWFSYAKIEAPFDGIITRRVIHTGHFVQPTNSGTTSKAAEPLFVVMRTDIMRVVVQVPEYDAPLVKDGADAVVRLQAYRGQELKCKVTRTSWALDNNSRCLRVELFVRNPEENGAQKSTTPLSPESPLSKWVTTVDNPELKLEAGMYANVSITADVPKALTLPTAAVLTDGNKDYIFVMEDGKAKRVNVHVGVTNGKLSELMAKEIPSQKPGESPKWVNFTGHEQVITSNLKSIQDGQAVKVKQGS